MIAKHTTQQQTTYKIPSVKTIQTTTGSGTEDVVSTEENLGNPQHISKVITPSNVFELSWREIFMKAPVGMILCEMDGHIICSNQIFDRMFLGYNNPSRNMYDMLFGGINTANAQTSLRALAGPDHEWIVTVKTTTMTRERTGCGDIKEQSGVRVALENARSTVIHNFVTRSANSASTLRSSGYAEVHLKKLSGDDLVIVTVRDVTTPTHMQKRLVGFAENQNKLLTAMFPIHVLDRLIECGDLSSVAAMHENVCILFADVIGFTSMCSHVKPQDVMNYLNQLFCVFDSFVAEFNMYKLETIGDCYVAVAGLVQQKNSFVECIDEGDDTGMIRRNTQQMLDYALTISNAAHNIRMPVSGKPTEIRVGVHCGPVTSGIVGLKMPRYCLFGDTINVASRMESTCPEGYVHMSQDFYDVLPCNAGIEPHGPIEIKGKGSMMTYKKLVPVRKSEIVSRGVVMDAEYKHWTDLLNFTRKPASLTSVCESKPDGVSVVESGGYNIRRKTTMLRMMDEYDDSGSHYDEHAPVSIIPKFFSDFNRAD